jgi:membrane associated rhomboid family serine protease
MSYLKAQGRLFSTSLKAALSIIAVIWIIHLFQVIFDLPLFKFGGLFPREIFGIKGIFLSPFLHGDWMHLVNNSIPLIVMITIIGFFYRKVAVSSIFYIYLLTGISVWFFGRSVYHIGASGVVYGLVSFVFWAGIFLRNGKSIVLALIIAVLYSGMFLGVLPNEEGISWESHLIGGIVGIFVAFIFRHKMRRLYRERPKVWEEEEPQKYFFDQDTFNRPGRDGFS